MTSPLPDYEAALELALTAIDAETLTTRAALDDASGRVLAGDVLADRPLPPFNRAQMDGYALRAADLVAGAALPVAATVPAGAVPDVDVPPGSCCAIATGAALPAALDAVVQHELSDRGDRRGNPVRFTIEAVEPGLAVHPRGADAAEGDVLIAEGTLLGAHHIGIAASVGRTTLPVRPRPRVIVLTSGDELVPVDATPLPHQIRDSNLRQTLDLVQRLGGAIVEASHVPDSQEATDAAVADALGRCDVLVTLGGISAGDRDCFHAAFTAAGVEAVLHGAAIQPGKPVFAGRRPGGACVVALPGNPVSALACGCLFLGPVLRKRLGRPAPCSWRTVTLDEPVRPNGRRQAFRPARLVTPDRAAVPRWAGSGDLAHTARTDGLVALPIQSDELPTGTGVAFMPWP